MSENSWGAKVRANLEKAFNEVKKPLGSWCDNAAHNIEKEGKFFLFSASAYAITVPTISVLISIGMFDGVRGKNPLFRYKRFVNELLDREGYRSISFDPRQELSHDDKIVFQNSAFFLINSALIAVTPANDLPENMQPIYEFVQQTLRTNLSYLGVMGSAYAAWISVRAADHYLNNSKDNR